MSVILPRVIEEYINASNAHDVKAILSCFSDDALVHDEGRDFRGIRMVEDWIATTIEKYKFQFKPFSIKAEEPEIIVTVEVSGTFPGSPVSLDYHFTIENDKILS